MTNYPDFEGLENYLQTLKSPPKFIKKHILLTIEDQLRLLSIIKNYKRHEFEKTIENNDASGGKYKNYFYEFPCKGCDKICEKKDTKTGLIEHMKYSFQLGEVFQGVCGSCVEHFEKERKEDREEKKLDDDFEYEEKTTYYIENYLNPRYSWNPQTKFRDRWNYIYDPYSVNSDEIENHIKKMKYYDFLETPYWKAIAQRTKYKAGYSCQLCNSKEHIQTHHKTYENHGKEHLNLQDLIVLCGECHSKFHDKVGGNNDNS